MADEQDAQDTGRFHRLRAAGGFVSDWAQTKREAWRVRRHQLQQQLDPPDSYAEGTGRAGNDAHWTDRRAERDQLKEYHDIRVDGGIIASLLEARGLMVFGTGAEFTAEQDAVAEWLNDQFEELDLTALDIGTDALFYGYSLAEIRETVEGEFGKLELIEPWTTVPKRNNTGEIDEWEQVVKRHRGRKQTRTFDPEEIYHFSVSKSSGRDNVGMSMLGRAMSEATAYRENQDAIQNAVTLHSFPKWHIKLGREDGAVIDDNELRRARPKFDGIDELTKWVTGQDVDIQTIQPEGFEFEQITEHDLSKLAIAFMLPVEISQLGGGDGLGTGFPARLRERMFLLSANAQQRALAGKFQQLGKDILREYAPPDIQALAGDMDEFDLRFEFGDPITDMDELQTKVNAVRNDMTVNERREMFDLPPLDDESVGESFEPPGRPESEPTGEPDEATEGPEITMQDGNLSSTMIDWIRTYAGESGGSLDDSIESLAEWLDQFADEPATATRRLREGVVVFANAQGVAMDEAVQQPVQRLLTYYAENRNLAERGTGNGEETDSIDIEALLAEIDAYRSGFDAIVWAEREGVELQSGPTFANDDDVPANVRNRLEEASRFVEWADTEGVPPGNLRQFFVDKLSQPQGWSIDSLANGLRENFGARLGEPSERENIARTKSAALLNQAKRLAFQDLQEGIDEQLLYYWDGPQDDATTEACEELKELTNPEHGGTPRPRDEFDALMAEVRNEYFPDFTSSGDAIHFNERHALDAVLPEQVDVDPAGVGGMATNPAATDD